MGMTTVAFEVGEGTLVLQTGDITKVPSDAVANAANAQLAGGGGVDGAIHRAGGRAIMRELDKIRAKAGDCEPGDAVATSAGKLPAKWVLHAVGPIYAGGANGEAATLASCYRRCLDLAGELGARSLSLPAISTGAYGYPLDDAARIAVETVAAVMSDRSTPVRRVAFVLFGEETFEAFATAARRALPKTLS